MGSVAIQSTPPSFSLMTPFGGDVSQNCNFNCPSVNVTSATWRATGNVSAPTGGIRVWANAENASILGPGGSGPYDTTERPVSSAQLAAIIALCGGGGGYYNATFIETLSPFTTDNVSNFWLTLNYDSSPPPPPPPLPPPDPPDEDQIPSYDSEDGLPTKTEVGLPAAERMMFSCAWFRDGRYYLSLGWYVYCFDTASDNPGWAIIGYAPSRIQQGKTYNIPRSDPLTLLIVKQTAGAPQGYPAAEAGCYVGYTAEVVPYWVEDAVENWAHKVVTGPLTDGGRQTEYSAVRLNVWGERPEQGAEETSPAPFGKLTLYSDNGESRSVEMWPLYLVDPVMAANDQALLYRQEYDGMRGRVLWAEIKLYDRGYKIRDISFEYQPSGSSY